MTTTAEVILKKKKLKVFNLFKMIKLKKQINNKFINASLKQKNLKETKCVLKKTCGSQLYTTSELALNVKNTKAENTKPSSNQNMLKLRFQKRCKDSLYLLYAYFFPKKLNPETKIYIKSPKEIQINISLKNGIFSNEKLKIKKKKKQSQKLLLI